MSGSEKDLVQVVAWMVERHTVLVVAPTAALVMEGVAGLVVQEVDERRFGKRRRWQNQMPVVWEEIIGRGRACGGPGL
jgi:hypothetical protein